MKVRMTKDTFVNGTPVRKGTLVECDRGDANVLIRLGKAEVPDTKSSKSFTAPPPPDGTGDDDTDEGGKGGKGSKGKG